MISSDNLFGSSASSESFKPGEAPDDLGFGTKVADESRTRLLNRDGSFNAERRGFPFLKSLNLYHTLLEMSWMQFIAVVFMVYTTINAVFAGAFTACGPQALAGSTAADLSSRFIEAFFFSVQTFTTVGYGHLTPATLTAHGIATVVAFTGLLAFALAAGLVFARFSQAQAQIIFSKQAVVAPYRGIKAFEFRIANQSRRQLIEVEAKVVLRLTKQEGGKRRTEFYNLPLERDKVSFFPLHWTVVHPISEESPIYGFCQEDFEQKEAEFLILLTAIDEASSQVVHTRSSYHHEEVVCGALFSDLLERNPDGYVQIDLRRLHNIEPVEEKETGQTDRSRNWGIRQ